MSKKLNKLVDINGLREFKNKLVGTDSAYVQTTAVDQTIAGTKTFSKPIVGSVTGSSGSCTGNAASANIATKATQDAAGNTITTTYATKAENNTKANNSEVVHKSGDETIAGTKTFSNGVLLTDANAFMAQNGEYTLVLRNDSYNTYLLMSDKGGVPGTWSSARPFVISNSTGVCSINGNAATATRANSAANADTATNATNSNAANQLQAFVNDDFTGGNHYVKAIRSSPGWSTHLWMCYNNGAKMADEVSVNYANSAGSANTANSATTATYANWLRTSSHSDHLFHTEWDGAYFWTYVTAGDGGYRPVRVARSDSSGYADTATKLAQWYTAYPDGAEAHNAMWGGRDITAAFNNGTVSTNIANGTFRDIFPGDYITKQVTVWGTTYNVTWVIADCDYWINKGDQGNGMTAHHVAIVPQVPLLLARMNATNTTQGGYAGSEMYRNVIPACATGIINAFGSSHILTFRDGISNSADTSHVSSGIPQFMGTPGWWGTWVSTECNLMSEKMVYGAPICSGGAIDNSIATRQMSAFRLSAGLLNYNRNWWWLRDVVSSTVFAGVNGRGVADASDASLMFGVRPFALLI